METVLDLIAVLLGLAALFGYINHILLKLPHTIGLVVIALAVSLGVLAADALAPGLGLGDSVRGALTRIDFPEALMKGLLAFLLFAGLGLINYRGRMAAFGFRPLGLPNDSTAVFIHGNDERVCTLIADQNQFVVDQHRRGAHAVNIIKRPQRQLPAFVAFKVVGQQTRVREKDINLLSIRDRRSRGRCVAVIDFVCTGPRGFFAPDDFAAAALEAKRQKLIRFKGGEEDILFCENRRGVTCRQGGFPDQVFMGSKLAGQAPGFTNS